ncbi:hypothetical protein PV04_09086 [Phialophora macrospora]|uniref:Chitin-binding type-2 domain-containing protein n=1 Tax=Phialophora macrospora TaxID=1851006 RepID=A0A0D2CG51_9EURO|nr:hypothetical protein PV04_09086 [Phialophora macrospora]
MQFFKLTVPLPLVLVLFTSSAIANPSRFGEALQKALDSNPLTMVEQPGPAATPVASSSPSSVVCDFPPRPTGTCELGEMMPFPFNCTKFYMCTTFGPIMQSCPNGTVFDFEKTKCILTNETVCTGCCMKTDCDGE